MRKIEILKHYKSSLKKWQGCLVDIENESDIDYDEKYRDNCGFCYVHMAENDCRWCPLSQNMGNCDKNFFETLRLCHYCDWVGAEKHCKLFIAKIKREIKKVEKKS